MADEDPKWTNFIRSLPCAMCLTSEDVCAHHSTSHGRGKSQRAHDHQTFPLCHTCHMNFHDRRGKFFHWTKEQRKLWERTLVSLYRPEKEDTDAF